MIAIGCSDQSIDRTEAEVISLLENADIAYLGSSLAEAETKVWDLVKYAETYLEKEMGSWKAENALSTAYLKLYDVYSFMGDTERADQCLSKSIFYLELAGQFPTQINFEEKKRIARDELLTVFQGEKEPIWKQN